MRIETNCSVTNVHCIVNPRNTETVVSRRTLTRGQVAGHGRYACPQCQLKNAAKRSTDKAVFHRFPYFKNNLDVENQHFCRQTDTTDHSAACVCTWPTTELLKWNSINIWLRVSYMIGVSLNEPHVSGAALHTCVCLLVWTDHLPQISNEHTQNFNISLNVHTNV